MEIPFYFLVLYDMVIVGGIFLLYVRLIDTLSRKVIHKGNPYYPIHRKYLIARNHVRIFAVLLTASLGFALQAHITIWDTYWFAPYLIAAVIVWFIYFALSS